jgi:endonuclease/exonuclease/phosphatase family metal-dependent hydrolase
MYSIVTFNILANDFSNFSFGNLNKKELEKDMNVRYLKILEKLYEFHLSRDLDFICLQEVDCVFYKLLEKNNKLKQHFDSVYDIVRFPNKLIEESKYNTYTYGLLTLINKKHKIKTTKKIEISSQKLLETAGRKNSRVSQIIEIQNGIKIANTHLTGIPERTDMRIYEIGKILEEGVDFICGDFNEPNYKIIKNKIKEKHMTFYDEYFKNSRFATSYHPWNQNQKTKKFYVEPLKERYKSIDYILYPNNYKLVTHHILPNKKKGVYGMDTPFGEKSYWLSDHALIYVKIMKTDNENDTINLGMTKNKEDIYNLLKEININEKSKIKMLTGNIKLNNYIKKGYRLKEIMKNKKTKQKKK